MEGINRSEQMLVTVAAALGPELLPTVAFVGGCTTGLLLTDPFTKEQVRYTEDVDLIVSVIGFIEWQRFESKLRERGFAPDPDLNCRMRLNGLKVDFMPDDANILSYTNRWYSEALRTAEWHVLNENISIRLVTPPYFLATKLEAYRGRGNNDPLMSHDIEDILNLLDGRPEVISELSQAADPILIAYLAADLRTLLETPNFEYAVQSACRGDTEREEFLFERIEAVSQLG